MWRLRNDEDLAEAPHDQHNHDLEIGDHRDAQKRSRTLTPNDRALGLSRQGLLKSLARKGLDAAATSRA